MSKNNILFIGYVMPSDSKDYGFSIAGNLMQLNIIKALDKNIFVLFCGSPCQVIGLLNYLKKDYSNLFTIDFVCHGVPSPKAWRYYLKENKIKNIMNVNFREKQNGWENFNL